MDSPSSTQRQLSREPSPAPSWTSMSSYELVDSIPSVDLLEHHDLMVAESTTPLHDSAQTNPSIPSTSDQQSQLTTSIPSAPLQPNAPQSGWMSWLWGAPAQPTPQPRRSKSNSPSRKQSPKVSPPHSPKSTPHPLVKLTRKGVTPSQQMGIEKDAKAVMYDIKHSRPKISPQRLRYTTNLRSLSRQPSLKSLHRRTLIKFIFPKITSRRLHFIKNLRLLRNDAKLLQKHYNILTSLRPPTIEPIVMHTNELQMDTTPQHAKVILDISKVAVKVGSTPRPTSPIIPGVTTYSRPIIIPSDDDENFNSPIHASPRVATLLKRQALLSQVKTHSLDVQRKHIEIENVQKRLHRKLQQDIRNNFDPFYESPQHNPNNRSDIKIEPLITTEVINKIAPTIPLLLDVKTHPDDYDAIEATSLETFFSPTPTSSMKKKCFINTNPSITQNSLFLAKKQLKTNVNLKQKQQSINSPLSPDNWAMKQLQKQRRRCEDAAILLEAKQLANTFSTDTEDDDFEKVTDESTPENVQIDRVEINTHDVAPINNTIDDDSDDAPPPPPAIPTPPILNLSRLPLAPSTPRKLSENEIATKISHSPKLISTQLTAKPQRNYNFFTTPYDDAKFDAKPFEAKDYIKERRYMAELDEEKCEKGDRVEKDHVEQQLDHNAFPTVPPRPRYARKIICLANEKKSESIDLTVHSQPHSPPSIPLPPPPPSAPSSPKLSQISIPDTTINTEIATSPISISISASELSTSTTTTPPILVPTAIAQKPSYPPPIKQIVIENGKPVVNPEFVQINHFTANSMSTPRFSPLQSFISHHASTVKRFDDKYTNKIPQDAYEQLTQQQHLVLYALSLIKLEEHLRRKKIEDDEKELNAQLRKAEAEEALRLEAEQLKFKKEQEIRNRLEKLLQQQQEFEKLKRERDLQEQQACADRMAALNDVARFDEEVSKDKQEEIAQMKQKEVEETHKISDLLLSIRKVQQEQKQKAMALLEKQQQEEFYKEQEAIKLALQAKIAQFGLSSITQQIEQEPVPQPTKQQPAPQTEVENSSPIVTSTKTSLCTIVLTLNRDHFASFQPNTTLPHSILQRISTTTTSDDIIQYFHNVHSLPVTMTLPPAITDSTSDAADEIYRLSLLIEIDGKLSRCAPKLQLIPQLHRYMSFESPQPLSFVVQYIQSTAAPVIENDPKIPRLTCYSPYSSSFSPLSAPITTPPTLPPTYKLQITLPAPYNSAPLRFRISPSTHILAVKSHIISKITTMVNLYQEEALNYSTLCVNLDIENTLKSAGITIDKPHQTRFSLGNHAPFYFYVEKIAELIGQSNPTFTFQLSVDFKL